MTFPSIKPATIFNLSLFLANLDKILADIKGSDEIAAAVGPVKNFSSSLSGVSLTANLVILFFVILNIIPFSLNSFLNASSWTTFKPW